LISEEVKEVLEGKISDFYTDSVQVPKLDSDTVECEPWGSQRNLFAKKDINPGSIALAVPDPCAVIIDPERIT
jgi:hypothetical protein